MLSRDTDLIDEMLAVNPNSLHLQKGEIAVRCEGGALKPDIFTGISTWCAGTAPILYSGYIRLQCQGNAILYFYSIP